MSGNCTLLQTSYRRVQRKRRRRILLGIFLLATAGMLFAASAVFEMDAWSRLDLSKITQVDQSLLVYDAAGREAASLHDSEDRIWVPLSELQTHTKYAFIAAEDARFYDHFGLDVVRILGAAWADLKAGAYVQGASTISQQLIKLSHLTSEKQMKRKLEEAVLAYQLECMCSKEQILEMYVNYVYFGGGYYGVEAAARGYFGVHARDLTAAQSAQLAGILKSPSRFAPHLHPDNSLGRRNVVLSLMEEYGFLSHEACEEAKLEKAVIQHDTKEKRGYYVDLAMTEACELLGIDMETLLSDGYRIHTYLDAPLQKSCEEIFQDPCNFPGAGTETGPEAAIVFVDVESGGIAALLGGRKEAGALAYNRATRIRRQPGSVIKPILVYAPALESGYTAATMLLDEQMDFSGYKPSNAGDTYAGWVTMREAVTRSLNVPAVLVLNEIGVSTGKAFAQQVGIPFDQRDDSLALALGGFTYGVSPLQIAGAYAAFARGGVYIRPSVVRSIEDSQGNVLYERNPPHVRVMQESSAYVLTSMLQSVIRAGTGRKLGETGIPLAGKTGTTGEADGNRDIWMAAYNPEYAASVWIGYDSASGGQALPETATGGSYPASILKKLFEGLYPAGGAPDFPMPPGVMEYRIDARTLSTEHVAVLASALTPETESYSEVFVAGTEPDLSTSYWQVPAPPERISAVEGDGSALICFGTLNRFFIYRLYRQSSDGKSVLLEEFSGVDGTVRYEDTGLKRPAAYRYYVVPVHPQLELDGQLVTGDPSYFVTVKIR